MTTKAFTQQKEHCSFTVVIHDLVNRLYYGEKTRTDALKHTAFNSVRCDKKTHSFHQTDLEITLCALQL